MSGGIGGMVMCRTYGTGERRFARLCRQYGSREGVRLACPAGDPWGDGWRSGAHYPPERIVGAIVLPAPTQPERERGKGRDQRLPFRACKLSAGMRRASLLAIARAVRERCAAWGEMPPTDLPERGDEGATPGQVTAWLKRLGIGVAPGSVSTFAYRDTWKWGERSRWRAEFAPVRGDGQALPLTAVAAILGTNTKAVNRLIAAGYLVGVERFEGHEEEESPKRGRKARAIPHGARRVDIHPADFADFLQRHPEQYDATKVRGKRWRALALAPRRGPRWLRVPEVAARLGCSPQNVRDMLRLGDLQGVLKRDRAAITYYVREDWLYDLPKADQATFARTVSGRRGMPPERQARRARILAEREALQRQHDPEAKRLLCEVRDVAGRRRKAAERAAPPEPTDAAAFGMAAD